MRILVFVSVLGILISIAVLIIVIIKANAADKKSKEGQRPPSQQ